MTRFRKPSEIFQLDDQDRKDWQQYTQRVKRLKSSNRIIKKRPFRTRIKINPHTIDAEFIPALQPRGPRRGKSHIHFQACLDLHGMTQDQAYEKVVNFIAQSQAQHFKWVLIITGKGRAHTTLWWENLGILKNLVPRWLNEAPNRELVETYQHASLQDGGEGALYVMLKRS
ncbi:MAG: Smr/MutS family protein [Alphaproteobacteria bacterium]|nr:Smr/MutS family protein [Alphaproteobacteria bacterium]